METNRRIKFLIFTLIGLSLCVHVVADELININYKFKAGDQIREDVTLDCKIAPTETSEALTFSIRYPTTTFVSEYTEDRSVTLYTIYQPELIEAHSYVSVGEMTPLPKLPSVPPTREEVLRRKHREDRSMKEELQREVDGFFVQQYQIDSSGRLIDPPKAEVLADSMVALRTPFDFIGALPTEPIKVGDEWTQKIDHPQIGQLTVDLKLSAIEIIDGYECAKLVGTVSGKMLGPDRAEMRIVDGNYVAAFAIRDGVMIDEKITVKLEVELPKQVEGKEANGQDDKEHATRSASQSNVIASDSEASPATRNTQHEPRVEKPVDLYSLQITYTTQLVKKERVTAKQFETTTTALKLIENGVNALYKGNHKVAKGTFDQFLADYLDSPWRSGVEKLLVKTEALSHRELPMVATEPEREFTPMEKMRSEGFIPGWLVLAPLSIPEEARGRDGKRTKGQEGKESISNRLMPLIEWDFLESVGGEANVRPSVGDTVEQNGETLIWQYHDLSHTEGILDWLPGFDVERGLAYLATYFKSAKSGTFNVELGREDNNTIAIWVNGERIWHKGEQKEPDRGGFQGDDLNVTPVKINKGWNALLIKTAKIGRGAGTSRPGLMRGPRGPRVPRGRRGGGWRLSTRWHGMEMIDSKTAWSSHGEINTADGFNAVLADQKAEFVLTVDLVGIEKANSITGIDLLLPELLRNSDAKVVGDLRIGGTENRKISVSSTFADDLLKIRWKEKISTDDVMSVNFEARVVPHPANTNLDFGVKLVSANGSVVQELQGRNSDEDRENSNGFSGIKIVVDKSDVPVPINVKAEPVYGENDVMIRWEQSEDPRVNGYEILASVLKESELRSKLRDGEVVEQIRGVDRTEWTHRNLTPESTIAYTVKAVVVPQLKSSPSEVASARVGTDTTDPMPPMKVEEAIPLEEERSLAKLEATSLGKLISWEPSFSEDVINYEILRGSPDSDMVKIATVSANINKYIDVEQAGSMFYNKQAGSIYNKQAGNIYNKQAGSMFYRVRAVDDAGNNAVAELDLVSGRRDFYRRSWGYRERREIGKYFAMARRVIQDETESGSQFSEWNVDEIQQELVTVFAEQKGLDLLAPIYEAAIESDPENIRNYNLLAKIYLVNKKTDQAVETLEKTLPLVPNDPLFNMIPYYNLAQAYGEQGNAEKAIAMMKELLEHGPDMLKFWLSPNLAELYAKFEMFDEVRDLAQEVEETFGNPEAIGIPRQYLPRQIARIYAAGKFYDQAIRWFKELLFDGRSESWMRYELAEIYDQAGVVEMANLIRSERGKRGGRGGELRQMKYGLPQAPDLPMRTLSPGPPPAPPERRGELTDPEMGDLTKEEELRRKDRGETIQLSEFSDKLIFVNFFDLSPECLTMLRTLEEVSHNNKNLVVIGITMDRNAETVVDELLCRPAIEEAGVTYPIVIGTRAVHDLFEFAIGELTDQLPTTFAIIGNGNLIHEKREGVLSKNELQELIESMKQHRKDLNLEPNILWADHVIEFSSEYSDLDWSAEQILGPPDTYPQDGDLPTAWASESEDGELEFVKIGYEEPVQITGVKIYETYNPGSVERVEAIDEAGNVHLLWQGVAEAIPQKKRIFRVDVPPTEYKVQAIMIHLDSQQVPGWNQIDAVGVVYQE